MKRTCHVCRRSFEATRKDAVTCGPTCRSNKRRGVGAPVSVSDESMLVAATRLELESAGKLESMLGQQALELAKRMSTDVTGAASLSRELSRVMVAAVGTKAPTGAAGDDVDELRLRRDAKRAG